MGGSQIFIAPYCICGEHKFSTITTIITTTITSEPTNLSQDNSQKSHRWRMTSPLLQHFMSPVESSRPPVPRVSERECYLVSSRANPMTGVDIRSTRWRRRVLDNNNCNIFPWGVTGRSSRNIYSLCPGCRRNIFCLYRLQNKTVLQVSLSKSEREYRTDGSRGSRKTGSEKIVDDIKKKKEESEMLLSKDIAPL